MRVAVIINPVAGVRGTLDHERHRAELARRRFALARVDADIVVTERAGHARELAHDAVARGADVVVAWGGDGTVNEVASALVGGPGALAMIPAGSGNGLARSMGVPPTPERAIAHLLQASERVIDVGEIDGRLFVNVAGVGFDAHIAARFAAIGTARRGFLRYASIVAGELGRYSGRPYSLVLDAQAATTHHAFLLSFANGRQWGNGAIIAPSAELDDGLLDAVIVEDRGRGAVLCAIPYLFRGTLDRVRGVRIARVIAATVAGDHPLVYHADGESFVGGTTIHVRVVPAALRVRA